MRGTITNRKTKDGQIRYRAQIKIDREMTSIPIQPEGTGKNYHNRLNLMKF